MKRGEGRQMINIVVPILGESVTEATVARWLKQVGEATAFAVWFRVGNGEGRFPTPLFHTHSY